MFLDNQLKIKLIVSKAVAILFLGKTILFLDDQLKIKIFVSKAAAILLLRITILFLDDHLKIKIIVSMASAVLLLRITILFRDNQLIALIGNPFVSLFKIRIIVGRHFALIEISKALNAKRVYSQSGQFLYNQ